MDGDRSGRGDVEREYLHTEQVSNMTITSHSANIQLKRIIMNNLNDDILAKTENTPGTRFFFFL